MYGQPPGPYGPPPGPYGQPQHPQQQHPQQQYSQQMVPYQQHQMAYAPNPAPYGYDPVTQLPYSEKSKMVAGLLQLFLGKFGAGRFYTGHTGLAVGQLCACLVGVWVLSWFTCGISIAVVLWPMIDGIILMTTNSTDSDGRPLRS